MVKIKQNQEMYNDLKTYFLFNFLELYARKTRIGMV